MYNICKPKSALAEFVNQKYCIVCELMIFKQFLQEFRL
jgi:hypothetical protein